MTDKAFDKYKDIIILGDVNGRRIYGGVYTPF